MNTFVHTLRMFHKIYFVWHWPLPCSEYLLSVDRSRVKINLEPFLVETLQTLYYSTFNSQRFIEHVRRKRGGGGEGGARPPIILEGGNKPFATPSQ